MISNFEENLSSFTSLAASADAEIADVQAAARQVCASIAGVRQSDLNASLSTLAETVANSDLPQAALACICCGAIVEHGGNPDIALDAALGRLSETLTFAQLFAEACEELAADDDELATEDGEETEDDDPIKKYGEQVAERMSENAQAYRAVTPIGAAVIAMLRIRPPAAPWPARSTRNCPI